MSGKLKRPKIKITCKRCGRVVVKYHNIRNANIFCSRECRSLYDNPLGKKEITCKVCGKKKLVKRCEFNRGQHKFCSWECYLLRERPVVLSKRGGGRNCRKLRKVFKRDNGVCLVCGSDAKEVHHIISFREYKNKVEADNITNLISLCKRCHIRAFRKEFRFVEMLRDILKEEYKYEYE